MANTIDTVAPEVILRRIIDGTITSLEDEAITTLARSRMRSLTQITTVRLNNLTSTNAEEFVGNTNMEWLIVPKLRTITNDAYISYISSAAMEYFALPSIVRTGLPSVFIKNLTKLKVFDIGPGLSELGGANYVLQNSSFDVLILRRTQDVVKMNNSNCFSGSKFVSSGSGGTFYVPSALISSYQSATNWSTFIGYANNSIQAIEGSQYENYYADGTGVFQSVTSTLTNCSGSNSSTQVNYGTAYTNKLTANTGYAISSVSVTMKSIDVTSTVYNSSTGIISITSVNGPIVITATAE